MILGPTFLRWAHEGTVHRVHLLELVPRNLPDTPLLSEPGPYLGPILDPKPDYFNLIPSSPRWRLVVWLTYFSILSFAPVPLSVLWGQEQYQFCTMCIFLWLGWCNFL